MQAYFTWLMYLEPMEGREETIHKNGGDIIAFLSQVVSKITNTTITLDEAFNLKLDIKDSYDVRKFYEVLIKKHQYSKTFLDTLNLSLITEVFKSMVIEFVAQSHLRRLQLLRSTKNTKGKVTKPEYTNPDIVELRDTVSKYKTLYESYK